MKAAAKAARNKGPLPPQLWKSRIAAQPSWSEFDKIAYREIVTVTVLQNIYDIVEAWANGRAKKSPEIMRAYARLVKEGIAGKDV